MNFTVPLFFYFFTIVFCIRWTFAQFRSVRSRKILTLFLVLASYLFYMSWNFWFGFLILFTSVADYKIASRIYQSESSKAKKFLFLSLTLDLGILFFFKYFNFFLNSTSSLFAILGWQVHWSAMHILLPVGISFYTFQSLSYTIDVYRGIIVPEKKFTNYALYLSFFPQLVAGPIVAARQLIPELKESLHKRMADIPVQEAFYYLLMGYIKKAVIADRIAPIADFVYSHPEQLSYSYLWLGVFAFSIEIYCDFSGYTDIARGLALLLGVRIPQNFNMPYFASSLSDFWRRWHITLSSWLRDYLYIPLGGNRKGQWSTYRNLLITMVLGGLWHGASSNFLIWGFLHGAYLALERFVHEYTAGLKKCQVGLFALIGRPLAMAYSMFIFVLVSLFWIFFRAPMFSDGMAMVKGIFQCQSGIQPYYSHQQIFLLFTFILLTAHLVGTYRKEQIKQSLEGMPTIGRIIFFAILIILAILFSGETKPFIYFIF